MQSKISYKMAILKGYSHEIYDLKRAYIFASLSLVSLLFIYFSITVLGNHEFYVDNVNMYGQIAMIAVLSRLFYASLKACPDAVWTGAVWFPLQSAVFFGFGPLVEVFGSDETKNILATSFAPINNQELFRANTLSLTGITLIILAFLMHMQFSRKRWLKGDDGLGRHEAPLKLAMAMIVIGGGIKYLFIKPVLWGGSETPIPGTIITLARFIDIGFSIVCYKMAMGDRNARRLFFALWPLHFFLCVLSLSKQEVISAILFPIMGLFIIHKNIFKFFLGLTVIIMAFPIMQPWISYGRSVVFARTGTVNIAGYGERALILVDYLSVGKDKNAATANDVNDAEGGSAQGWWLRLNYAGVQARAMELYDSGQANPELNKIWVYFVPRIFWRDKPNLNLVAVDFYRLISRDPRGETFVGISFYGDLYWQYGWLGIFIGCPLIGWLYAYMATNSLSAIRQRNFLMMPVIMMALILAILSPTETVMDAMVGGSIIYFCALILLRFFTPILMSERQKETHTSFR